MKGRIMVNEKQVRLLKRGFRVWNKWRSMNPDVQPDLGDADLSDINLSEVNLINADLHRADLIHTNLSGANLRNANLNRTNLSNANLSSVDLSIAKIIYTNLDGANLNSVNLSSADLTFAKLHNADLTKAIMAYTVISSIDFRETKGLAAIEHQRPSDLVLYTIQLPQDGSALHFLRGAGVPEEWIDDYRVRMMHPIQYHSLFISYSSKDEILAYRLHADLQASGVRCWFAPHDMRPGTVITKEIDRAIHIQEKVLLLLSQDTIASGWVDYEVEITLAREREQKREILFPIRLDETVLQITTGWAATLRKTRHIGDFTNWNDPFQYRAVFGRLLHDLQKEIEQENIT